jgi:hypothetical protein
MITFKVDLVAFGYKPPVPLLDANIWTSDDGQYHQYCIADNTGFFVAKGKILKTKSGHRNPVHLLAAIFDDIDLSDFDNDYITTIYD